MTSENQSKPYSWDQAAREDHWVAIYDTEEIRDPTRREQAFDRSGERDAASLRRFVTREMRVVDLGCGVGRIARHLAPHCRELVGVDLSSVMLDKAAAYLKGLDNVRLESTAGNELTCLADGSVDFVYSMLCLIHAHKRCAYRYLAELGRVLTDGGMAYLEFQNILSPEGLAKFKSISDLGYPLEFYAPEELRWLIADAGLHVYSMVSEAEYLRVALGPVPEAQWLAGLERNLSIEFDGPRVTVENGGQRAQPGCLVAGWTSEPRGLVCSLNTPLVIPASGKHDVELCCVRNGQRVGFELGAGGENLDSSSCWGDWTESDGKGVLTVGFVPAGVALGPDGFARVPWLLGSTQSANFPPC